MQAVEFRLLGPIEVQEGGLPVDLGPPQRRVVLAALAVDAGRPVTLETLIDRVWDETPPEDPRAALYVHVTAIRKALRSAGGDRPVRLPRQGGGYVLEVDPDSVDVHRFRRLTATAGDAQRSDRERATLLSEALGLWRGTPLDGVSGDWAARMRTGWTGLRLDAAVAWAETGLRLGLAAEVIGPVRELLAAYPLAESLVAVLMRGLAGTGRHAEALSCYAAARTRLAEELGMEPGPQLRTVHQTVLRGELDRSAPDRSVQSAAGPVRPVPEQLPAGVPDFVARERELSELDRLAGGWQGGPGATPGAGQPSTAVTILAISGTAGVGKTALAVRWAHRVRGLFPDGQLYVNLRGYDPDQPVAPTDALARFLRALGVSGQDIPLDLDQRTVAYRTLLDRQRTLVVLDNAASVEQVRPLLPGSSSCAVVVTSRDSLAGLVALHGARRLDLDLLPPADAVDLLGRLIGARVLAESDAAAALADQCARLPLALRVAAELAAARPSASLSELVTELADQQDRLDLLDAGGDPRAAVQAVFSWSCQQLPADAAGAFRLLGLHPGADLDTRAAAALIATTVADARRLLDGLLRAHLVYSTGPARYGMHDLLRGYALRLTSTEDPDGVRQAALTRLYDHYLATATGAVNVRFGTGGPGRQHAAGAASVPAFPDPAAALAWLDAERATIVAVCGRVAGHGRPDHAIRLAAILFRYLHVGGHFPRH